MGFTNPWLLLGLAALAAPILVHLVLREERSGRAFPSLMFVRRISFELKRRRQLRHRTLLALRCLALAALVFAFANPHMDATPLSVAENRHDSVWLLDRSYSMSHPRRWEHAVAEIRGRITALAAGERAALVAFDDSARIVAGPTPERASLRAALARIEPGEGGTGFAAAFDAANRILARRDAERRSVVIVSDLQRSALDAGGVLSVGEEVKVEIVPVTESVGPNIAVLDARLTARRGPAVVENTLAVRVRNTGDAPLTGARIAVEVDGRDSETQPLALGPGEERTLTFPIVLAAERPTRITVQAGPDALPADNRYHAVLAPRRPLIAALIEPDRPRPHHGIFLEEALRLAQAPAVRVRRVYLRQIDESLLDTVDVLILDDVALPSPAARVLERFVTRGGGVLVTAGPSTVAGSSGASDGFLANAFGPVVAHEGAGKRVVVSAADHPLWTGMDPDGRGVFPEARITTSRMLHASSDDRVLVRLDDGSPLLVEHTEGAGRILALATTADPRWGTLVLEPGFVPFVPAAAARLAGGGRWRTAYTTGESVDLPRHAESLPGAADWRDYLANGGALIVESPSSAATRIQDPDVTLFQAGVPGIHEVHRADGGGPALPFAVNAGRDESMLATATPEELERRIVRRTPAAAVPASAGRGTSNDARFGPAWWLLVLAGLALILETVLANHISQRQASAGGARP